MYLLNVQGKWALILCSYIRDWMLIEIIFVILECGVLGTQFVVIHSFSDTKKQIESNERRFEKFVRI